MFDGMKTSEVAYGVDQDDWHGSCPHCHLHFRSRPDLHPKGQGQGKGKGKGQGKGQSKGKGKGKGKGQPGQGLSGFLAEGQGQGQGKGKGNEKGCHSKGFKGEDTCTNGNTSRMEEPCSLEDSRQAARGGAAAAAAGAEWERIWKGSGKAMQDMQSLRLERDRAAAKRDALG